jgi:hypothetical protein
MSINPEDNVTAISTVCSLCPAGQHVLRTTTTSLLSRVAIRNFYLELIFAYMITEADTTENTSCRSSTPPAGTTIKSASRKASKGMRIYDKEDYP